ncbi:MAG: hypothetical protein L6420_11040, partial [Elusimicrobia bacterium]|nr:hypothetical protein [Elusimicrobiota bacterium]
AGSSQTANIFATVEGLYPPTTFFFRIKAMNSIGVWNNYAIIGSKANGSSAPVNPIIAAVYVSSITVSYEAATDVDGYLVEASTVPDFSGIVYSSSTDNILLETLTVQDMEQNATYYMRAGSLIGQATDYANTDPPTATLPIETPTSIAFDEITCGTITASAYAATPGFSNLQSGLSATNVAIDEAYAGWHTGGNTWVTKAVMPTARRYLVAAAVGGKIYAIGGTGGTNKNEEYDPATNSWTVKANMPTARTYLAGAAVGGKIYVIGGTGGTNKNEEYDPETNTWITKADMPTARDYLAAAAAGGKIYAVGGYNGSYLNTNEEYDPINNIWITKAVMPTARSYLAGAAVGGKIYAVGGYNGSYLNTNEEYDPINNIWITKAVMPTARYGLAAAAVGGKIFVVGGVVSSDYLTTNEEYDPATDTWVDRVDMPTARANLSGAMVDGKLYAVGGYIFSGGYGYSKNQNEVYDPGVAQKFTGLIPNTEYDFKAKARNMAGTETAESVIVSTYTLAYSSGPVSYPAIYTSSVTVAWSSGTVSMGYNGPGATYLVQASRLTDFSEILGSSQTYNIFATVEGLTPPGTFYFRIKAANNLNVWNDYFVLGSTSTGSAAPINPVISAVYESSITVNYGAVSDVDGYIVEASATSDFSAILYSSSTDNILIETLTVQDMEQNATYYMRAGSLIGQATDYANTDPPTATLPIETPTDIVFEEITCGTITASAYAATPGFSNLHSGESATNVAIGGDYAGWHTGGNTWLTKAVMPTARSNLAAVAVGGKIYAIGGLGGTQKENQEYDPAANSWTGKAVMTTARNALASAVVGGKLYAIGGTGGTNKNEEYDPETNTWTTKAVMPTARYALVAATVGGKVYAIGGDGGTNKNEEYDPETDTWATKADMPTGRFILGVVAVAGKIYAIGGTGGTNKNEEYDSVANTWTTKAVMPTARYALVAAAVGGKIYAIGGYLGTEKENEEYDPLTNTWTTKIDMPTARNFLAAAAADGKIYAVGGGSYLNTNEEYDPGVAQKFTGLIPNTEYSFKAKARNMAGTETAESVIVSTYTLAYSSGPASFPGIY